MYDWTDAPITTLTQRKSELRKLEPSRYKKWSKTRADKLAAERLRDAEDRAKNEFKDTGYFDAIC